MTHRDTDTTPCKPITVVALCKATVTDRAVRISEKFHTGMLEYVARIPRPWACLLPRAVGAELDGLVDTVELPLSEVPYRLHVVDCRRCATDARAVVEAVVRGSAVVSCGPSEWLNETTAHVCREFGVPYIVTTEYTLRTQLDIMRSATPGLVRRRWRARNVRRSFQRQRRVVTGAVEYHANGYPTYEEFRSVNPRRRLYFDSRIGQDDVIGEATLKQRLSELRHGRRAPRLIYSGRYHPMKGVLDVVRAGIHLLRDGVSFRLDLYGSGPLRDPMRRLVEVNGAHGSIFVNDAVPFRPDLLAATAASDLFLCCHVQGDPSCTYLETFARGVPVVGYANEMWSPLSEVSGAGVVCPERDPLALSKTVIDILSDHKKLEEMAERARTFAQQHIMGLAWDVRCAGIEQVLAENAHR